MKLDVGDCATLNELEQNDWTVHIGCGLDVVEILIDQRWREGLLSVESVIYPLGDLSLMLSYATSTVIRHFVEGQGWVTVTNYADHDKLLTMVGADEARYLIANLPEIKRFMQTLGFEENNGM